MSLSTALSLSALVSALVLLRLPARLYPVLALVASGLEVAMAFDVLSFDAKGLPLGLILGGTLTVAGALSLSRASAKPVVVAATVVTFVGAIQVLRALGIF